MLCKECGKINEDGKFCESCGAKLETGGEQETATSSSTIETPETSQVVPSETTELPEASQVASSQTTATLETSEVATNHTTQESNAANANEYVDKAKDISKTYFSYFLKILKSPLSESKNIQREEFINGVITIALYALFIPAMIYLSLGSDGRYYFASPFLDILLKPALGYVVFLFLITVFIFVAVQLGNAKQANIKDVIARFGALLVPFVGLFIIGFVLALLQTGAFIIPLSLGFAGSALIGPTLVIQSFKKDIKGGLDTVYGVLLTFVLTGITLGIMSAILLESIMNSFGNMFNMFY